jgi:cell division cycle protein 37
LASLKAHASEAAGRNPGEVAFKAVMESAGDVKDDQVPPRPEGLHSDGKEPKTYSQMMAALLDEVNKALDEKKPDDRYQSMMTELEGHVDMIHKMQKELTPKLDKLLKEEGKKITSADIHTGFDSSHVAKAPASEKKNATTEVELLNPNVTAPGSQSSSEVANVDDDEDVEASPAAKKFAQIESKDYAASLQFLSQNPQIVTERETDGLLVLAFDAALERKDDFSRQCVHQALLLQYCRLLGKDGVGLFFKRVTTQEVFYKDVQETYMRIKNRSREILAERAKEPEEGVEQIQLHAVEPGTVINIRVPAADSQDVDEQQARDIFDGFQTEMKSALETGDLDQVNKVLGKMKVDEAEELVALFAEVSLFRADLSDTTPPARTRTNHWHRQISSALRSKSLTLRQRKGRNSGRSWRRQPRRTLKLKKDRWEIRNR